MKTTDITATGDPTLAKATVEQVLQGHEFTVSWSGAWTGTAEKGSKVKQAFAGAFSPYYKIGLAVMSGATGQYTVRIQQLTSGAQGGLIQVRRTKKLFDVLTQELAQALAGVGTVISSVEA